MPEAENLFTALCKAEVAFVVVGSMAGGAYGSEYAIAKLEICYQREPLNFERLSAALRPFRPRLRGAPADFSFVLDAATIEAGLNFALATELGDLDLIGEVAGLGDHEAVMAHSEELELYGYTIRILTLEGLIISKQAAGRPKDLLLLAELKALQAVREESDKNGED